MKLADATLLANPKYVNTDDLLPVPVNDRRRLVGLRSANGGVLVSLLCIHKLHRNCVLGGCTCTCHLDSEARKATMNALHDQFLLGSMMD